MKFKILTQQEKDFLLIKMEGSINEHAVFELTTPQNQIVKIDLSGVLDINSSGISCWMEWIKNQKFSSLSLIKVSRALVRTMAIVQNFIPAESRIESFFVPYFDEVSGDVVDVIYEWGKDYSEGKLHQIKEVKGASGQALELDVVPEKYFKIIQNFS